MDKEWTKLPRFSEEYFNGVESFLDFAYTKGRPQGDEILCPCAKCRNHCWAKRNVVYDHLIGKGFLKGYNVWVNHGERILPMEIDNDMEDQEDSHDDIDGLLYDTFRDVAEAEGVNEDARKFYNLVKEAKQELYPGCKNFTTLSFIIQMYLLKCLHGWTNASFTALLELLKESMPHLNIPESFNKTKAIIKDLGLDDKKIHAIKKQHSNQMTGMAKKVEGLEALVRCLLKQNNPNLDEEALDNIMGTALGNENSAAPHSSTSTHVPKYEKLPRDAFANFLYGYEWGLVTFLVLTTK